MGNQTSAPAKKSTTAKIERLPFPLIHQREIVFGGFLKALAVFLSVAVAVTVAAAADQPISLHPENPHYFLWRGQPTVLITSGEHYGSVINLDFDYSTYLEELGSKKLNNTRVFSGAYVESPGDFNITENTLAPAAGRFISPWARSDQSGYANGGNKFDLTQWDANYFSRLRDFMEKASECGVVVEMNLFCPFYEATQWNFSPQNAINNVNDIGDIERTSVYTLDQSGGLLAVHEAMTCKIVTELNEFDNLYYEICNEPYTSDSGVTDEWQHHIAELIVATEQTLPNQHLISQNIANGSWAITQPHPAISIFNFHYAQPPTAVTENYWLNKVIGDNETGWHGTGDAYYRMEAWEFILAGGSLYNNLDFSFAVGHECGDYVYPGNTPGGGNAGFRQQMTVLRDFINSFDFVHMEPDKGFLKAGVPENVHVYALSQDGQQYAACFFDHDDYPTPQSLSLTLLLPAGDYRIQWIDVLDGGTTQETVESPGTMITITSPEFQREIALSIIPTGCAGIIASGQKLAYDISGPEGIPDCYVDMYDLESLASNWLYCNDPEDPDCFIPYTPNITEGLVGRWEFEGDYLDSSGYGAPADGTAVGDVTLVTDPERGSVLSVRPNATSTSEPMGYVDCGNDSKFNFTTAMTLCFWYKEPTFNSSLDNSWRRLVTKGEDCWRTGTAAYNASDNMMQLCLEHNNGSFSDWTSNLWTDENWVFLSWTWQAGEIKLYADGEEVFSDDVSGMTLDINSASVAIGEIWEAFVGPTSPSYGRPNRAFFDDVRLYNRSLSQSEIQVVMGNMSVDKTCVDVIGNGHRNDADITGPSGEPDCRVNLYELGGMGAMWLLCNDPEDPACVPARK